MNKQKYEFRWDRSGKKATIGDGDVELLTAPEVLERIKTTPHCYERIMGKCVPYFDFDISVDYKSDEQKDRFLSRADDYVRAAYLAVEAVVGGEIYVATSHGLAKKIKDNGDIENKVKISFHIVVRGIGYFSCGQAVKQTYYDKINAYLRKQGKDFECDDNVYKGEGSQQLMRTIYSTKKCELQKEKRYLFPLNGDMELDKDVDEDTFKIFLVTNISREIKSKFEKKTSKAKPKAKVSLVSTTDESDETEVEVEDRCKRAIHNSDEHDFDMYDDEMVERIIKALPQKYATSYWTWRDGIWAIASLDRDGGLGLAKKFTKQTEDEPNIAMCIDLYNEYDGEKSKKITFATILGWLKKDKPKTFKKITREIWGDRDEVEPNFSVGEIDLMGVFAPEDKSYLNSPRVANKSKRANNLANDLDYDIISSDGGSSGSSDSESDSSSNEVFSEPTYKPFDINDPYTYSDFNDEMVKSVFENYQVARETAIKQSKRVLALIRRGNNMYIKKDNCNSDMYYMLPEMTKKANGPNFMIKYKEKDKKGQDKRVKSIRLIDLLGDDINTFKGIVCDPDCKDSREFNIWSGFKAQKVTISLPIVQPILDFIKEIWANNDEELYKWILSWLATAIQKPATPIGTAIFAYSKQGAGKNTLSDFLRDYVFGDRITGNFTGIDQITGRFNKAIEGKKLNIVNEMASTRKEFISNFDKMKTYITDVKIRVEPKGSEGYDVKNIGNWLLFTNHEDALHIDASDRRYCCIELNDMYIDNSSYWSKFYSTHMNQDTGNQFYSYLLQYECCNVKVVPKTQLKELIQNLSKSSQEKFIDVVREQIEIENVEDRETEFMNLESRVGASALFETFKLWCARTNEHVVTSTKFGLCLSKTFKKVKSTGKMMYVLKE